MRIRAEVNHEPPKHWPGAARGRDKKTWELMRQIATVVLCLTIFASATYGQNPVPYVSRPLASGVATPGGPAFTLTVNGSMFVSGATVNWNGHPLKTTFVSRSQLTAAVPATDIATASTASITVANSGTAVVSNTVFFEVTNPESTVYYKDEPGYPAEVGTAGAPAGVPLTMTAGDLLSNGKLDLAFAGGSGVSASGYGVSVLLSNGDGTFTSLPLQGPNQVGLYGIAKGDFTGNGRLDLVVTNQDSNTVSIMLNNGDGTFSLAAGSPIAVGPTPAAVGVGDFNRDGKLDLAVVNSDLNASGSATPAGSVTILLGNGDGTFTQAQSSPIAAPPFVNTPYQIAVGDFNGDGALDLAMLGGTPYVWVLLGNGDDTFKNAPVDPVPTPDISESEDLAVGDFNGDGNVDVVATGLSATHAMNVLLGNGDGTFTAVPKCCGFGDGNRTRNDFMALGDFNGDGKLDVAILSEEEGLQPADFVQVLLGGGDGTFTPTDYAVLMNAPSTAIAAGDFDGDGRLDLAVLGGGPEAFWSFVQVPNPTWPTPPDFTISAKSSSLSVTAGGTVTDDITISSQYGFYGAVTASCSGTPALATCSLPSEAQMMVPLENLLPTLTITTTAPTTSSSIPPANSNGPAPRAVILWVILGGLISCLLVAHFRRRPSLVRIFALAVALVLVGGWSMSCGGGGPAPTPAPKPVGGTPAGTYTITVTAVSPSGGGLTHSIPITLTVQ